jgi:hypothetical protein
MKHQELEVVDRSATSETVEEPTRIVGVREAGDMGAPWIVSPHKWERQKDSERWMLNTWITRNLIRVPIGKSSLEEERL